MFTNQHPAYSNSIVRDKNDVPQPPAFLSIPFSFIRIFDEFDYFVFRVAPLGREGRGTRNNVSFVPPVK